MVGKDSQSSCQSVLDIVVFLEFGRDEFGGQCGFGFKALWGQAVDVADFFRAFGEVADLDKATFQKVFDDVVDLAQADAGVVGQFALGGDDFSAKGVEDGKVFFC